LTELPPTEPLTPGPTSAKEIFVRLSRLFAVLSISFAGLIGVSAAQITAAAPLTVTFTTLTDFGVGDGQYPSPLAQGTDGNLYGAAYYGPRGANGFGFYLTPTGAWTLLNYSCTANYCTGSKASAGMTLAGDGNFYGTTAYGGDGPYRTVNKAGTIYRANAQTGLTTIYSFCSELNCKDGDDPYAPLTLGSDGNLYGTTQVNGRYNAGLAYVVSLTGSESVLHNFCALANCADGSNPSSLIQATDGNFYGVAGGGAGSYCVAPGYCGMIFKMTPQGVTTTLYNFCSQPNCTDGAGPRGGLIQAADGNLYGMTSGGINYLGFYDGTGSIFKLSLQGKLTTLYAFCSVYGCNSGIQPGGLIQGTDGNFYGTVYSSEGAACGFGLGCGTIFEFTSTGVFTTLHTFCELGGEFCSDGIFPGPLVQGTDGDFYGTTYRGGPTGYGTAFKLSTGLSPFVQTVTSSGKTGASVIILGNNLSGATSVTFNGMSAGFTVVSSTEITATVPTGATTGPVVVTTPSGTLKSNKKFRITN
jgi:uncharacterized repeat protein (TIGR03803 family)